MTAAHAEGRLAPGVYIPIVTCKKCGKRLEYGKDLRRLVGNNGKRVLDARCHNQSQQIPFASEPGHTVELWGE